MAGEHAELRVHPADPTKVYDPACERWVVKRRITWDVVAFAGRIALISLLNMITLG